MLPKSHYSPPGTSQKVSDHSVTGGDALQLREPVVGIRPWASAVPTARVPEAPIDEHRDLLTTKDDIGANP